jgi:DNA-binding MarR family transcriptional regulator
MTRLLDRLEKAGLLQRERAAEDRRGAFAVLTESGAKLRRSMWPHYQQAILEVFGEALSASEAESLVAMMKKVIVHRRGETSEATAQ